MDVIDFRSDTVTWPTPAMREAMAQARVGDDVYGEDPTVNELEALAAEMLGHEAGLLVSSGTQGNLIAMLTHAGRGDEVIVGQNSHIFQWTAGGMSAFGSLFPKPLPTDALGRLDTAQVVAAVNPDDTHKPRTRLLCTENSSGGNNGAALPPSYFAALRRTADEHDLRLHLDGARLFNATTALGVDPQAITQHVDSVMVCLSKGLCAPIGSVLVGPAPFIHQARRSREALGGGMRQAGVLAAAGLIALRQMTLRLAEDHRHARLLAEGLAGLPALCLDPAVVQTNMVFFDLADEIPLTAPEVTQQLWQRHRVHVEANSSRRFRALTHYWIDASAVERLVAGLEDVLSNYL